MIPPIRQRYPGRSRESKLPEVGWEMRSHLCSSTTKRAIAY
ncbi:MAG TPA: hypothetical protein V6C95_02375 [Coleofasciculaceae cyanobacterium]